MFFLAVWNRQLSPIRVTALRLNDNSSTDLPIEDTLHASTVIAIGRPAYPSASPHRITNTREFRNVNRMSIGYAFRPHLRIRLTLSGLTFLRKPWAFGERVSHPFSRYSFRHNHFCVVQPTLRSTFALKQNAPLPDVFRQIQSFGGGLESRTLSAQDPLTSELLRTL